MLQEAQKRTKVHPTLSMQSLIYFMQSAVDLACMLLNSLHLPKRKHGIADPNNFLQHCNATKK